MLLAQMGLCSVVAAGALVGAGGDPAGSVLLGLAGAGLPLIWVVRARSQRARAFEMQLPQALEIISLYLRSGRSLPQAFVGATEEMTSPAADPGCSASRNVAISPSPARRRPSQRRDRSRCRTHFGTVQV